MKMNTVIPCIISSISFSGYYCPDGADSATFIVCPPGSYCPLGSVTPSDCSAGTFSSASVIPCFISSISFLGYYCPDGADSATFIVCPPGSYCPLGSVTPSDCSAGTFSSASALTDQSECLDCTSGYYCPNSGKFKLY